MDIFFVISGFVMTISSKSLMEIPGGMWTFITRRFERIVPLYWLATTLKIALLLLAPSLAIHALGSAWFVASSYLFLSVFNHSSQDPVLPVGWTLNYEMLFYVIFAVIIGMKWRLVPVLTVVLGSLSALAVFAHLRGIEFHGYDPIVLEFLAGVILAKLTVNLNPLLCATIAFSGFAVLLYSPQGDVSIGRVLIWGLPAVAIVAGAIGLERRIRVPKWVVEIGDASYAIYITHGFVLPVVGLILAHLRIGQEFITLAVVTSGIMGSTILGIVVHRFVDQPMLDYFHKRRTTDGHAALHRVSVPIRIR